MSIEVRDPVHGTIVLSDGETAVVDSPEFQRLRAIKQLGFADISFPGATHTRFLHSIGVCHLAGQAFDSVFGAFPFSRVGVKWRLRQALRLAALLHDVGHGPLSHTTEDVMPKLKDLDIKAYAHRFPDQVFIPEGRATHEDYTIKFITDSGLTEILKREFPDISALHIACLIDKSLKSPDDFFIDNGLDFRPVLSQLVSSELDVDRMDYLERDSYFTGTNYGKIDQHWIITNLRATLIEGEYYLGLNRRALYTFDDFLISRHHIHLMVYFHHKAIIFEEMLTRYLESPGADFKLPADINAYRKYNDFKLYEHLADSPNEWAQRISSRRPYKVLMELHSTEDSTRPELIKAALERQGFDIIWSSSKARLSKYHSAESAERTYQIYVVDQYDRWDKPTPIDRTSEIFKRYEGARVIHRLYIKPEEFKSAESFLQQNKI
jgi:HD superfamily phosphohydrolase